LGEIPAEHVATYQSFWAAKLHLLQQVGDVDVNECLKTALALATDLAARIYLSTKYGTSS
jgi:predicted RNA polymerase sigma factor